MGKAIEMKDADATPADSTAAKTEDTKKPDQPPSVSSQLAGNVSLLESAVRAKETRVLVGRLLRQTTAVRKRLTAENLADFVKSVLPQNYPGTSLLLMHLNKVRSWILPFDIQGTVI